MKIVLFILHLLILVWLKHCDMNDIVFVGFVKNIFHLKEITVLSY